MLLLQRIPFLYERDGVKSLKKIKECLLVEASSANQSKQITKLTKYFEYDNIPHVRLNSSRGIVICRLIELH